MRRHLLAAAIVLSASGCQSVSPQSADGYRVAAYNVVLPLGFAPGGDSLSEADRQSLIRLTRELPESVVPDTYASGRLALPRVRAVEAAMQRPTRWIVDERADPERVLLVVRSAPEIVADACRGPGVRLPGTIWPGSEDSAPMILPPGCAVANSIKVQTTSPADLIQGQRLPPGAALPYAAAIERYYHRNDQAPSASASSGGAAGADAGSGGAPSGSSADPAQAAPLRNPLLGPLPANPAARATTP